MPHGPTRNLTGRIIAAGLIAGALDLLYVEALVVWIMHRPTTFVRILQSIAAGLYGPASFNGGASTAVQGLLLHFLIAFIWTLLFLLLVRRWADLRSVVASPGGAWKAGLPYGCLVWLVMELVVVPLSHAKPVPLSNWIFWVDLAQQAIMVGVPIALLIGTGEA
ncbi:MAG TPA: hypothetical protein VGI92_06625 [Gemmatimonadales bacterium]